MTGDVPWTCLLSDLRPETQNSFWAFGEAGDDSVEAATLADWYARHDDGYYGELARWFPELSPAASIAPDARLEHWNQALRSDRAPEAIANSFRRHRARDLSPALRRGSGDAEHGIGTRVHQ